ncbi:MAG: hypothetical protein JNL54_03420 [Kineosporiaceae bacterium]|nr:hypothetical protein [Kineosporiaceae bacterium]
MGFLSDLIGKLEGAVVGNAPEGPRLSLADLAADHSECDLCGGPMGPMQLGPGGPEVWGCPEDHGWAL